MKVHVSIVFQVLGHQSSSDTGRVCGRSSAADVDLSSDLVTEVEEAEALEQAVVLVVVVGEGRGDWRG